MTTEQGTTETAEPAELHGHVTRESADCDGSYSRTYVHTMTDDERSYPDPEYVFRSRVVGLMVSLHGTGSLSVTPTIVEWSEQTDEGFVSESVTWCRGADCDDSRATFRDHSAERAGY
jgi:hypothetical protein